MSLLPKSPLVQFYGGILFPTETQTLEATATPVMSSCGRRAIAITHAFHIRTQIAQANQLLGATTEADMRVIRARLGTPGLEFHFEAVGYGPLAVQVPAAGPSVGAPSVLRALQWGPLPQVMRWEPEGQHAAQVDWRVSVSVACEESLTANYNGVLEWCWKWSVDKDASGYSTRRISGFVRVAGWINPDAPRITTDQADRLREDVVRAAGLVPGFRRGPEKFTLDESKTRLDYEITDIEAGPVFMPEGCVVARVSHEMAGQPLAGVKFKGSITAQIEIARDRDIAEAESVFWEIVQEKMKSAENAKFRAINKKMGDVSFIPLFYHCKNEDVFGKQVASFRYDYHLMTSLESLAESSGIWKPLQQSDWARWASSLASTAFNPRGWAGLRYSLNDDALVDLCLGTPGLPASANSSRSRSLRTTGRRPKTEQPDPGTSWLEYINILTVTREDSVIPMLPLPPQGGRPQLGGAGGSPGTGRLATVRQAGGDDLSSTAEPRRFRLATASQALAAQPPPPQARDPAKPRREPAEEPIVQRRAAPIWHAHLDGLALRAGWPISPPVLLGVGGCQVVPAFLAHNGFSQGQVGNNLGVPIYFCEWNFRYLILGDYKEDSEVPPRYEG